ncbi:MAG: heparan-alpha-glucosaminide N-acetyltransferase domain-containing protein [Promethearchaeota archaeon]
MKRYKSIDMIRGLCMIIMVAGHMLDWWLTEEDYWLYWLMYAIFAPIGASGFVFISGTATILSYQKNILRPEASEKLFRQKLKNIYILRASFLLLISFIYNYAVAIMYNDISLIWSWNILQTLSLSFILAYPLLKTSKIIRLILAIIILIANEIILGITISHIGQVNIYGVLYYILYNPLELYPILPYFTVFLIGTVVGDLIYNVNLIEDQAERKSAFKKGFIIPLFLLGFIITTLGIWYLFPNFLIRWTISATLYSIGILLLLISISFGLEEFEIFKMKQNHRFFFFYSYYSFTIYLAHNPLYFLFYRQLNVITIWVAVVMVIALLTILLRVLYNKLGPKASLKVGIAVLSFIIATKIEQRNKKKILNKNPESSQL